MIPQTLPSRLRRLLCKYSKYCFYFKSKCSYCRYLSTEVSFRQLSFSMRVSKSATAPIIKETTSAIWTTLQAKHTPSPTGEIFQETVKDFNIRWNFPNCVGSIDGKHIRIKCPPNSGSQYFNYKQYHSIALQAVLDAYLKFVTVDVGAHGKQSDGGVFWYSALYQSLETRSLKLPEDNTVLPNCEITLPRDFVGDEVYPLTTYL